MRLLPDCRVDGDTPASDASASGVGNRPRASPISASSRAARRAGAPGQGAEDVRVGVGVQLLGDLVRQGVDLHNQGLQRGQQGPGHVHRRGAGVPDGAAWSGDDAAVHRLRESACHA